MKLHFAWKSSIIFLFFIINLCPFKGFGQDTPDPLSRPVNREILNHYQARAKDFADKNLNRFAIDRLQSYDRILDSLYLTEKKDTLASIENNFQSGNAKMKSGIDSLRSEITELTGQKDKYQLQYSSLLKKSVISFIIWFAIVLVLLQIRGKRMKRSEKETEAAITQLQSLESSTSEFEKMAKAISQQKDILDKLNSDGEKINSIITSQANLTTLPAAWPVIISKIEKVKRLAETESKIANAIILQSEVQGDEKISTDINSFCEAYVEIASRGFNNSDSFNCQISRDFEKRLPAIKVNQNAVGALILNILTNALQAVKEKNAKGIKNYTPKITVSTRILPRFLQIRIRDNGMGMNEPELQSAMEEFYSTRPLNEGSGLGLNISKKIISEIHKGEIKIESEPGASTDVYIKFFI